MNCFRGGTAVSQRRLTKTQIQFAVMTGVSPSFRVGVSFRAILFCLILNRVLVVINIFMNPKLPLNERIYTLTAGRVLNTIVFQINLGKLLFRATLKVRLGSCLKFAKTILT